MCFWISNLKEQWNCAYAQNPNDLFTNGIRILEKSQLSILQLRSSQKMADQPEPPFKELKQEVNLNDLPVLPFEKILSHLSLEDRIKSRAVSRRWCQTVDSFRVKTLCRSNDPVGFIWEKSLLVSGRFAQNFISSSRFDPFFKTFGQTIVSNLKHLCLSDLYLKAETTMQHSQLGSRVLASFSFRTIVTVNFVV